MYIDAREKGEQNFVECDICHDNHDTRLCPERAHVESKRITSVRTVMEVYKEILKRAHDNVKFTKEVKLGAADRNKYLGASQAFFMAAALLEQTEEINPTK